MGRRDAQVQPMFKKKSPNKDVYSDPKANYERDGGSQGVKPTCSNCGKKHCVKCLSTTSGFLVVERMIIK